MSKITGIRLDDKRDWLITEAVNRMINASEARDKSDAMRQLMLLGVKVKYFPEHTGPQFTATPILQPALKTLDWTNIPQFKEVSEQELLDNIDAGFDND